MAKMGKIRLLSGGGETVEVQWREEMTSSGLASAEGLSRRSFDKLTTRQDGQDTRWKNKLQDKVRGSVQPSASDCVRKPLPVHYTATAFTLRHFVWVSEFRAWNESATEFGFKNLTVPKPSQKRSRFHSIWFLKNFFFGWTNAIS